MTRPSKKLSEKYLGLLNIIAQAGPLSWTLRLPDSMQAVHPIFHVSMLEPSITNTILDWVQTPPLPVMVDGEPEYEISKILKLNNRWCLCKLLYLVKWLLQFLFLHTLFFFELYFESYLIGTMISWSLDLDLIFWSYLLIISYLTDDLI